MTQGTRYNDSQLLMWQNMSVYLIMSIHTTCPTIEKAVFGVHIPLSSSFVLVRTISQLADGTVVCRTQGHHNSHPDLKALNPLLELSSIKNQSTL